MNIRQRVTMWVTSVGLCTSLLFSVVVFWEMSEQPYHILDAQLNTTAGFVADLLRRREGPVMERGWDGDIWISVHDGGPRPLYQSAMAQREVLPPPRKAGEKPYTLTPGSGPFGLFSSLIGLQSGSYRVKDQTVAIDGETRHIRVAIPIKKLHEELRELLLALVVAFFVSGTLLVVVMYQLAGRMVRPFVRINQHVRQCHEGSLEQHLPLEGRQDEIRELSANLNRMFDRLRFSFVRQKQHLAAVSHELKTPLAMLRLFVDEAEQRSDLPADFFVALRRQGHNVLRLDRMVRSLLELSALEANGSMEWEQLDLTELLRSILEDFAPLMSHRGLRLTTRLQEAVVFEGDREKLRRLLINILDNAVRYNEDKGWLEMSLAVEDELVILALYNGGRGIPAEELEHVFEQFHRVEKSRSQSHGGVGLGLAIVREIVRLHRGRVVMHSRVAAWTRITVELPQSRHVPEPMNSRDAHGAEK